MLDKTLFTTRNSPLASLHWPQNSSKIDSNRYLDLPCFSRPPKSHFKLQNVSTWPQHGSNLGPTCLHLGGLGGCKTCQSRPWSPTCQPRPHIAPPRCLQGRILVDVGLMLERFSAVFCLISSSSFWCWDRWLLDQITKRLIYQTGFKSTKLPFWKSRGRRQRR